MKSYSIEFPARLSNTAYIQDVRKWIVDFLIANEMYEPTAKSSVVIQKDSITIDITCANDNYTSAIGALYLVIGRSWYKAAGRVYICFDKTVPTIYSEDWDETYRYLSSLS